MPLNKFLTVPGGYFLPSIFLASITNNCRTYNKRSALLEDETLQSIWSGTHLLRSSTQERKVLTAYSVFCLLLFGATPSAALSNSSGLVGEAKRLAFTSLNGLLRERDNLLFLFSGVKPRSFSFSILSTACKICGFL